MMLHQQSAQPFQSPATDALLFSMQCCEDQRNGKMEMGSDTNEDTIFSLSQACSAPTQDSKPRLGFDLGDLSAATELVACEDSFDFPRLQWVFDKKLCGGNVTTHASLAKRRKCRGLVRSMSSSDLSEMFETRRR